MNSRYLLPILLVILFCWFDYPANAAGFSRDREPGEETREISYNIGPQDLITISVFEVPELNITVRISEDGTITLPLLGRIKVEGMTRFQLEKELARRLEEKYLKNAQVTIFIKEYQSKLVSIIGEVEKPGNYELIGRQTLLQVLSTAGGLGKSASDRIIIIRRYKDGRTKSLVIDLDELMLKGNPRMNIPLQPGDVINIPAERFLDIYVFGQVKNPGHIKVKMNGSITLLRVIAQAGGFAERARKSAVTVTRRIDGKDVKTRVNVKKILSGKIPDFILEDNDIVHVRESIL
ncbi:MAG: polysaccharide biosynthesis/export family protein [Candidatus Aminicenantes bacterium]|nr:MAG: polysaccharide biosynthesis/export family protein [Candidatus Aminicenantes bacterium]